ncbi:hypothetical protein ATO6_15365 [Oceanicola sp. 22II-s10i]|uniref:hypothetical protein n=1 Tax=Oceanicola sp. 22II-s10i TaxID=1317116 RepID=UPI000B5237A0|nr:hypothetical protein [Oceanicola sp. 22II-s10i]OWU83810.1 hypothetical protein ATO6_15365 [Oceanicola sp. 22II-s10i]
MTKTVIGADRFRHKLRKLEDTMRSEFANANRLNGQDILRLAHVLHPGDGETRADMSGTVVADDTGGIPAYLVDFGAKSKVTEGDSGPRPFVNPALKVSSKRRRARSRRAASRAVKKAFNG